MKIRNYMHINFETAFFQFVFLELKIKSFLAHIMYSKHVQPKSKFYSWFLSSCEMGFLMEMLTDC